jgi:hypothetical protein
MHSTASLRISTKYNLHLLYEKYDFLKYSKKFAEYCKKVNDDNETEFYKLDGKYNSYSYDLEEKEDNLDPTDNDGNGIDNWHYKKK